MTDKVLLSVKEASCLFGIGRNRLREIVRDDRDNVYHLTVGRTIRIKRRAFEDYLEKVGTI